MQRAGRQVSGTAGGDPEQVGDPVLVDDQECFEDRRHQDSSPGMRFEERLVLLTVGLIGDSLIGFGIRMAAGVTQGAIVAYGNSELPCQLSQKVLGGKISARLSDLVF